MMMLRPVVDPAPMMTRLSRIPRWVTALGMVLLVAELTGAAALLAAGPHAGRAIHAAPSPQAGTPTAPGTRGETRTVLLRVDGEPLRGYTCTPVPPVPCGPEVGYGPAPPEAGTPPFRPVHLPFTRKIQVKAGGSVTLNAYAMTVTWIRCSISVDGQVLSEITAGPPNSDQASTSNCWSPIPPRGTDRGAVRHAAVLRVGAAPDASCGLERPGCGSVVSYTTPTGEAASFSVPVPFTATVPVPPGGTVNLDVVAGPDLATCSITANGTVLSQVTTGNRTGMGVCRATIP